MCVKIGIQKAPIISDGCPPLAKEDHRLRGEAHCAQRIVQKLLHFHLFCNSVQKFVFSAVLCYAKEKPANKKSSLIVKKL